MNIRRIVYLLLPILFLSCSKKTDIDIAADSTRADTAPTAMTGPTAGANNQDQTFIMRATFGNQAEVDLGKLALSKTKTATVKQFAQMMVDEHSKAHDELMQILAAKSFPADTTITLDTAGHAEMKQKLATLSGKNFDKEYISVMVKDHEKARDLFQLQSTSGSDPELKAYAAKHLEAITKHLQHAREMDTVAVTATR